MHGVIAGQFPCRESGNEDPAHGFNTGYQYTFLGADIRKSGIYELGRILRLSTGHSATQEQVQGCQALSRRLVGRFGGFGRSIRHGTGGTLMNDSVQHSGCEPAIREGDRIATILVAYHFLPSREVGAKRMSALARYLTAQGRAVAVISAFAGLASSASENAYAATLARYDL